MCYSSMLIILTWGKKKHYLTSKHETKKKVIGRREKKYQQIDYMKLYCIYTLKNFN